MKYITFDFTNRSEYKVCILSTVLNQADMEKAYLTNPAFDKKDFIAYQLYSVGSKTTASQRKEHMADLLPYITALKVKYLVVAHADYFKTIVKKTKAEPYLGYTLPLPENPEIQVIYVPNHMSIFYDPDKVEHKIKLGMDALLSHMNGTYSDPGSSIIKKGHYPKTVAEIKDWIIKLYHMNVDLAADIETFSLKHYDAGIGTISFSWNKGEGVAFPVDLLNEKDSKEVRKLLKIFFTKFKKRIIWHNISFDVYILIYQLFMKDLLDTEGLLNGMDILLNNWECSLLITYLATNSCAGNELSLKDQAQDFAGNYAQEDIKDIRKIPLDQLLEYNLIDTLSTWHTYEKHYPVMVADKQLDIYTNLFKPAIKDIIQMQLTGLPLDMEKVKEAKFHMELEERDALDRIENNTFVRLFTMHSIEAEVIARNAKYKKKVIDSSEAKFVFNPGSSVQLQELLYDENFMALPVLDYTKSKQPSTDTDTLKKLKNHTQEKAKLEFLDALLDLKAVSIILTTFIPPMLNAPQAPDGWHYLYGSLKLGGTVSGRLSSSNPNLQNLPANSRYAKLIKQAVRAPKGWQFVGLDFASLEDRISALWTKDPNKLKVYTEGYDGHCLRAYSYFGEHMPDIVDTVESINSIAKKYPVYRQDSKAPTFALTYQGTFLTLVKNCGFTKAVAMLIEERYHELYAVSDKAVQDRLVQATIDGYITVAFGLRIRTPLLQQVILGNAKTPHEAEAEGRTAGNAMGQSYGLLNTRAASAFMAKVRASEYRLKIKPCVHIHDAQYYLIRDDIKVLHYMNTHLVKEVEWQEDPLIAHDQVKLGGEVSVFFPSWNDEVSLPNRISIEEIQDCLRGHSAKLKEKGIK